MKKIVYWDDASSIKLVSQAIKNNELIIGTTDTILGLFAQATIEGKVLLDCVKKREKKPYIALLSEKKIQDTVLARIPIENILYSVIKNFWPGPLTIIFDSADISGADCLEQETVAVRVPAHEGIQMTLEDIGMVFSTSANFAGQPFPRNIDEIDPEIMHEAAYCIIEKEDTGGNLPSTIIRYDKHNKDKPITMVREGAITKEQLSVISEKLRYLKDEI